MYINTKLFYNIVFSCDSYDQTKINKTAHLVATWLNDNNFDSVQAAIKNGTSEQLHAIETISMKEEGEDTTNTIFQYNQETIDSVRQSVAGWLTDNGYGSVQEVFHLEDTDVIASMMEQFAPINEIES